VIFANGKKYFTLSEANSLVPQLESAFGRIQLYQNELESLYQTLADAGFADPRTLFEAEIELPPQLAKSRTRLQELADTIHSEMDELHELGCVVKSVESGLVDFYSRQNGRDIFLCWQQGETEIRFWHPVEEGYAGRRPIDPSREGRRTLN